MRILAKLFLLTCGCTCLLLLLFQGYFFLNPQFNENARAARLKAVPQRTENQLAAVNKEEEGLFVYLTFETASGLASSCSLLINDELIGDFSSGLLSAKVFEGDKVYLLGGRGGEKIKLMAYPENLQKQEFPASLTAGGAKKLWGVVRLK